jgi:hypothetical protein
MTFIVGCVAVTRKDFYFLCLLYQYQLPATNTNTNILFLTSPVACGIVYDRADVLMAEIEMVLVKNRVCVCVLVYVCLDTLLGLDVRRGFTSVAVCHQEPCSVCVFCLRILFA